MASSYEYYRKCEEKGHLILLQFSIAKYQYVHSTLNTVRKNRRFSGVRPAMLQRTCLSDRKFDFTDRFIDPDLFDTLSQHLSSND